MLENETVAIDDSRLRLSHTPGLRVAVDQPGKSISLGRRRIRVSFAIEVSSSDRGGRLTITTRSVRDRLLTALVGVGSRYQVVPEYDEEGRERMFVLQITLGKTRRLLVVEHAAGLSPDLLPPVLPEPAAFWRPRRLRPRARARSRGVRAKPPFHAGKPMDGGGAPGAERPEARPEVGAEAEAAPEVVFAAGAEPVEAEAAPEGGPEPIKGVLAEVGANMPSQVHLDDTVPVEVLLSREEVPVFAGTTQDEQVIVMDPDRPLNVVLLRRGFDLDDGSCRTRPAGAASHFLLRASPS